MINTNLPPILHRFGYSIPKAKSRYISLPLLRLNPSPEGFPWDDLRTIFRGCQWMVKVPNGEEKLSKISIGWVGCTNVTKTTDRQTDRQTDRYIWLALLRLTPPPLTEGFPWHDLRKILKFFVDVNGWPRYQTAKKNCRKFQTAVSQTDDRRNGDSI